MKTQFSNKNESLNDPIGPQLNKSQWIEILSNPVLTKKIDKVTLIAFSESENHTAAGSLIAPKVGLKNVGTINLNFYHLANRISKKYDVEIYEHKGKNRYWRLFFTGYRDAKHYYWSVRKEVLGAMTEMGMIVLQKIIDTDLEEQEEIIDLYKKDRQKIIAELQEVKAYESESIIVKSKIYKRDNKTIALIKILRDFECQICQTKIKKAEGGFYIEAAHIKAKKYKGRETPDNILILCPNHHKEFDYGVRKVILHTKEVIEFDLNEKRYKLNLKIE